VTDQEIIEHYIKMAKLMSEMFAPNMEVLIHDLTKKNFPIIEIFNGHVTGRKKGDPSSVFDSKIFKDNFPDYLVNYYNESPQGHKLKSSTLCIKNKEKTIAALGVNYDISYLEQIESLLKQFMSFTPVGQVQKKDRQHFLASKDEIIKDIEKVMMQNNFLGHELSKKDKKTIVRELYMAGSFNKHGIISVLADKLKLTRMTIYKYVKEIREKYD
jgi:predicted transcriptional regulator YheO